MARKSVRKKIAATGAKTAERLRRDQVITFRVSSDEAAMIARAADRVPLARYSRDAVLTRAREDAKARK